MKTKAYRFIFIAISMVALVISGTFSAATAVSNSALVQTENAEDPWLSAVVVVRAASGVSFMVDRQTIASMPRLETIEAMRAFVAQYEPATQDMTEVRTYLERQGFKIVSQDNLFLIVSGRLSQFTHTLGQTNELQSFATTHPARKVVAVAHNAIPVTQKEALHLMDGMLIFPSGQGQDPEPAADIQSTAGFTKKPFFMEEAKAGCENESKTVDDVAQYLKADVVHRQGFSGKGVRIGIIDQGLYVGHPFFFRRGLNYQLYQFVDGEITRVGINFHKGYNNGHGNLVTAYLNAIAPQAQVLSFAKSTGWDGENAPGNSGILAYLNFMNQDGMLDILSLSIGWSDEDPAAEALVSVARPEMINLMARNVIVLVAAGNAGQCINGDYCSGHNALAAIPEVIAVGGADTSDDSFASAAGGYDDTITGAASFDSIIPAFAGRHVPDVVGIFGPDLCFPYFKTVSDENSSETSLDEYWHYSSGTSGATPQIAGIVALLKQKFPSLDQATVRTILQNNAFDIINGVSGDEEAAGVGYDDATGYGMPLASWVLNGAVYLQPGWNLIGLTKEHSVEYTALDLITEMRTQGIYVDNVTYWPPAKGKYEGVQVSEGTVYGNDFLLDPNLGYFVHYARLGNNSLWRPSGDNFFAAPQPLDLRKGINIVAFPYVDGSCSAYDLYVGTGRQCNKIAYYAGQWQEVKLDSSISYGRNFMLNPGKGYLIVCDQDVPTWTPVCTGNNLADAAVPPLNVYQEGTHLKASSLNTMNRLVAPAANGVCSPENLRISNLGDQTFSVSWTTQSPCTGSVVVAVDDDPAFQAFDDRGFTFSGATHHITLHGLRKNTTYSFGLLSGTEWDDNGGLFYQVKTGLHLSTSIDGNKVYGQVMDASSGLAQDAVVYARLQNSESSSTWLSFPLDDDVQGFTIALGNARTTAGNDYYDSGVATHLNLSVQGGSLGVISNTIAVDFTTSNDVQANMTLSKSAPSKPTLLAPIGTQGSDQPVFRFRASDPAGRLLKYRLELSLNNFADIERVYDQANDPSGWSATAYASGEEVQFTLPDTLQNFDARQWRVFAYNGEAWSISSDIQSFSVSRHHWTYLPVIKGGSLSGPVPNPTPQPTPTPFPTPTATPSIPTPNPRPMTNLAVQIYFQGRKASDPVLGGHNIPVRVVIRKLDGTVLYSMDDVPVVSSPIASQDYGTFILNSLEGFNININQTYEILITGKMHLTRKWTFTPHQASETLNLSADQLWAGDINNDNVVNLADYDLFIVEYTKSRNGEPVSTDPNSLSYKSDLNGDKKVSLEDYAIFIDSYNNGPDTGDS